MAVDVSVYGGSFTDNEIEVYYIQDPEYTSINTNSVPANIQVPLLIETNFYWESNDPMRFWRYANFTCKFTLGEDELVTQGRMERIPLGSFYQRTFTRENLPTHIICPSPQMDGKGGSGRVQISPNGVDYTGEGFPFELTPPADIYRVAPQSGPIPGESKVKLIGGGFKEAKGTVYAKMGNFELEPISKDQCKVNPWNQDEYLGSMLMTRDDLRTFKAVQTRLSPGEQVQSVWSRTATAPHPTSTPGGPVFVTAGQVIEL